MASLDNPFYAYRVSGSTDSDWTLVEVTDGSFPESFTGLGETEYEVKTKVWSPSAFITTGEAYDADYQAILDYATTQGDTLPSLSVQIAQNQVIVDLKAAGVFSQLDFLHVWRDGTTGLSGFKSIDWIRLSKATLVNSPSLTINGIQGNGTTSYVDLNYNPTTDAINYLLNNHSIGAFNANSTAKSGVLISNFGSSGTEISNDNIATRLICYDNGNLFRTPSIPTGEQDGHLFINRDDAAAFEVYKNNVDLAVPAAVTSAMNNASFRLFSRANNSFYGNGIASYDFGGGALTAPERQSVVDTFNTYFAAL